MMADFLVCLHNKKFNFFRMRNHGFSYRKDVFYNNM